MSTTDEYAKRTVLDSYRRNRRARDPYYASREERDSAARYLAEKVLAGEDLEYAKATYRAARAIHAETVRRADIGGGRDFSELNATERFWNTGRLELSAVSS